MRYEGDVFDVTTRFHHTFSSSLVSAGQAVSEGELAPSVPDLNRVRGAKGR